MPPLEKNYRNLLERTVKAARDIAEDAARIALEQLGVGETVPYGHLTEEEKQLRVKLRVHGQQLGDICNARTQVQEIGRLKEEVAYEHWHRMLFARFLAENDLLMYPDPDDPVPVTLTDCDELAEEKGVSSGWELAACFASDMLPQIFRKDSPVFQLTLPPEHQQRLEKLLVELPSEVLTASDSLGWVYQFWQAKKKDEVNASEVKIGARELPAVTQLFTEPYMVSFLLDNSLGAWWAVQCDAGKGRRGDSAKGIFSRATSEQEIREACTIPGLPLEYLRFVKVEAASSRLKTIVGENVEAASSRLKTIGYFQKNQDLANLSGNLPHWRQENVTYFVTFRTADSLPKEKLDRWLKEKEAWLKRHPEPHDEATRKEYHQQFPERIQQWLDQGHGECLLAEPKYREIVEKALKHLDGDRYDLGEYVVMPNHVHVIVTPKSKHELSKILHSWKSYTATEINKRTGKSGAFWQKESFDHIVRNPAQLERIRDYIKDHVAYGKKRQDDVATEQEKRQDAASTVWVPAAGTFDGWPSRLADLKTLDPCCGSGHFLVAAFLMLVPMRMERDGLSAKEAVDAVLRENIHGLEIDRRCVELAAFNLAFAAWRYLGAGGYRRLPALDVACSGLSVGTTRSEWEKLANGDSKLRTALVGLYEEFKNAPLLGSLIDPLRSAVAKLIQWEGLAEALGKALYKDRDYQQQEAGVAALGLAEAARILAQRYHLVITNVPYLARGKQDEKLRSFCEKHYPEAKNDLATVFLDRCLELCVEAPSRRFYQKERQHFCAGTVSLVLPQNWLFLTSYKKFREKLLKNDTWHLIARLGPGAFETISGEVVKAILISLSRGKVEAASSRLEAAKEVAPELSKRQDAASTVALIRGLDDSEPRTAAEKAEGLLKAEIKSVAQARQLENPNAAISVQANGEQKQILEEYADVFHGITTTDYQRFGRKFWEIVRVGKDWVYQQSTVKNTAFFSGKSAILFWEQGKGGIKQMQNEGATVVITGLEAWGQRGVSVNQMNNLPVTLYQGSAFDTNVAIIVPKNQEHLCAIYAYCESKNYRTDIRDLNQKLNVEYVYLNKTGYDLDHWTKVAEEKYPNGLPKPYTNDPTQWIFHGHPCGSVMWNEETKRLEVASTLRTDDTVLQVAVARLLGYRWPAELESRSGFQPLENKRQDGASTMELADEQREWVKRCETLAGYADDDGIVCIPPVRGEASASDRLLNLLAVAYGDAWTNDTLAALLKSADHAGKTLETWLREKFFTQHCKLFQHRPFIWHIWDGLRDGFGALVNYHKLDRKKLETLIYTYLGDWIGRCRVEAASSRFKEGIKRQDGASTISDPETKMSAAEGLKKRLELILEGEAPYDIFVRWKPIEKQPIGWDPDLNDGVRLNIRPFLTVPDVGKKDAGVLRDKRNIKWNKDRGKDVLSAPWYHLFKGDRINDHHLSLAEKRAARQNREKEISR